MTTIVVRQFAKMTAKQRVIIVQWTISMAGAILTIECLRWIGVAGQIDNQLMAIGFDIERVLLIEQLLLVFLGSMLAGLLFQRNSSVWTGSVLVFVLSYLIPFIQQAQHPGLSPANQRQVLLVGTLSSVVLTLFATSVLVAGAGSVIGKACGQVLLLPLVVLGRCFIARIQKRSLVFATTSFKRASGSLLVGIFVVIAIVQASTGLNAILTYGPSTNLYLSPPLKGTLRSGIFTSPVLGGIQRTYWIYLPPSYTRMSARHYPTIYLLHGSPGSPADWFKAAHASTTADALIMAGRMRETILIGADGNGMVYRSSEWANSFDGRQHMEDAIVHDLVRFIDSHYRTLVSRADRTIGGLSMGGYGAANIALHHPEMFGQVLSLAGYFQSEGSLFGSGSASMAYRQLNSPLQFLLTSSGKQAASSIRFIIGVGTADGYYFHQGVAFYEQLRMMGVQVRLITSVGGHSWPLWARQFGTVLPCLEPLSDGTGIAHC